MPGEREDERPDLSLPSFRLRRRRRDPASRPVEPRPVEPRRPILVVAGVGVAVGLLAVGLTWLATRGCEVALGTASCGGGPGLLLLLAILVLLAYAGRGLLVAASAPSPTSTSILAVALLAVLVLLFLVDHLGTWAGAVAMPLIGAAAYAGSHLVTTAVPDDA